MIELIKHLHTARESKSNILDGVVSMFDKKVEIVKGIINKLARETASNKLQWSYYQEKNFSLIFGNSDSEDESTQFVFSKKSLRKSYKKIYKIDSIKEEASIFTKISNTNGEEIRVSIINCRLASEDDPNDQEKSRKKEIYLLICDFEESDNYENIAESESLPEVKDLYEMASFVASREIRLVYNYFFSEDSKAD